MPPKSLRLKRLPASTVRSVAYYWCALALPLFAWLAIPKASLLCASAHAEERSTTSAFEDRETSLAQGRRIFDATVRPRLDAYLAPSAIELGQRECSASTPKEPVRGVLDRAVVLAASEQLNLPMGSGSVLSVAGRHYLFCLEPHYHPPGGGTAPEGWHKGVTVYRAQTSVDRDRASNADPI
ncbi:MAG TPA: hypothetical protein VER11_29665 [Polyangiaceae bacterium]|nr:hypothetical protein [Polyangiaceae bacterium]